ncbi:bacterio-opsin activator domain-containing protein [Haloplanus halophilus]|uniref:bacterio-opsin activator domain-containing protein n=1 Tax=Haloplanus halophilus TaxID=2949993 RepID=UPI00203E095E|nr:bacterio-opsin activator domain-containing protein [Haloplanus sp. GDY1]
MNSDTPRSDSITEVEFALQDPAYPMVHAARELDCRVDVLEAIPATNGREHTLEFLGVDAEGSARVVDATADCPRARHATLLERRDGETLLEVAVADAVVQSVADAGAVLSEAHADDEESRLTVSLPPTRSAEAVVEGVRASHPSVRVVAVTERPVAPPFLTPQCFRTALRARLTDRQWQTLRLAHEEGYFERPRDVSQSALAEGMGICQETVSQHLRAAQRHLLSVVFENDLGDGTPRSDD